MHDFTIRALTEDRLMQFEREADASRLARSARKADSARHPLTVLVRTALAPVMRLAIAFRAR